MNIDGTNDALQSLFEEYEESGSIEDALSVSYRLIAAMNSNADLEDLVFTLVDTISDGETYTDAYSLYEEDLQTVIVETAVYVVNEDIDLEEITE